MNASSLAGYFARGGAAMGLIASLAGLAGWQLTPDQQEAISGIAGGLIVILWPLYEKFHAKGVKQKSELAGENIALAKAANVTPSPIATAISEKAK